MFLLFFNEFHAQSLHIKIKYKKNFPPPPVPNFYQTATGSTEIFFTPRRSQRGLRGLA